MHKTKRERENRREEGEREMGHYGGRREKDWRKKKEK